MAVDDIKVQKIIDDTIRKYDTLPGCCAKYDAAFRDLQAQRRVPGASVDEDLAAAEHYMFARVMVCSGTVGEAQMEVMVMGYDLGKAFTKGFLGGILDKYTQTTDNPTAKPSAGSIKWGLRGKSAGKKDHDTCNAGADPPAVNWDAYHYGSKYGY